MKNKTAIFVYEEDGQKKTATFVTDLDENDIKNLRLDETHKYYEECLRNEEFMSKAAMRDYILYETNYTEASKSEQLRIVAEVTQKWSSIFDDKRKEQRTEYIKEQLRYIDECSAPIWERRLRVTNHFKMLPAHGVWGSNGKLSVISYQIPDEIFNDIYHIFADAICCYFQLNQYDGKYRDGMYLCLQHLDYKFWCNDYNKQYPNATQEEVYILNKTRLLDAVTGRGNECIEVQGVKYECNAFLEENGLFRLKIRQLIPWNLSNGSRKDFVIDCKKKLLWSLDERFQVNLDATKLAYYLFFYENPDQTIEQLFNLKDKLKECIERCDSGSRVLLGKTKVSEFSRELKKRISEINPKLCAVLGEAYSILIENGCYYVPISRDIRERPKV